jgi:preprotein translocase subunit Sec61beta
MAHNDKIQMPSAQAGLTRYFEEYHSKISFKPEHIIIMAIVIMAIVIFLHMQAAAWLGI